MRAVRISAEQRRALECLVNGDGPGEFWAQYGDDDALAWYRSERTLDSLHRRGWVDEHGEVTPAGIAVLGVTEAGRCA